MANIAVSVAQDSNAEWRPYMEDGHRVFDPLPVHGDAPCGGLFGRELDERWRFFAVYDGHGGKMAMTWLESHLHTFIAAELRLLKTGENGAPDTSSVHAALVRAFQKADLELESLGAAKYGSTATVALIHETRAKRTLYVGNVGDSRAVLIGGSQVKEVTVDHRATNPSEIARVESEGGCIFRRRVWGALSVTRAMGDHELKSGGVSCVPDTCACSIAGAHVLVIASDGLWDVLEGEDVKKILEETIARAMQESSGPECLAARLRSIAAQDLVRCAKDGGSRDNICALVAFL